MAPGWEEWQGREEKRGRGAIQGFEMEKGALTGRLASLTGRARKAYSRF